MRDLIDGTRPGHHAPSLGELHARRGDLLAVCALYGASHVRVFGSVARGEQEADSDVDFLVDIEPGRSLFDLVALTGELEDLLGCPVNIVEDATLRPGVFAERAHRDAVML